MSHILPFAVNGFNAIKLSREEVLSYSFADQRSSLKTLLAKYGEKRLNENEFYEGYILIDNGCTNKIAYISGAFKSETDPKKQIHFPIFRDHQGNLKNATWHKIYKTVDGKETNGSLKFIFTFGTVAFEKHLPQKDAETLRQKLIKSAIEYASVEISEAEDNALKSILGKDYKTVVQNTNLIKKKLKINKEALAMDDIFFGPRKEINAFKVTDEQAMRFNHSDYGARLDVLIEKYGKDNLLSCGEYYEGYALLYDEYCNQIIRMKGFIDEVTNETGNKEYYMRCQHPDDDTIVGYAKHIWTFGNFYFDMYCDTKLAERVRNKLIEATLTGKLTELANDELAIITRCFGQRNSFIEIVDIIE